MLTTITIHGLAFGIDTNDWYHPEDAAKGSEYLADWLSHISAGDAARIHSALSDEESEDPLPGDLRAAEHAAMDIALEGYAKTPEYGHNMCVVAL